MKKEAIPLELAEKLAHIENRYHDTMAQAGISLEDARRADEDFVIETQRAKEDYNEALRVAAEDKARELMRVRE